MSACEERCVPDGAGLRFPRVGHAVPSTSLLLEVPVVDGGGYRGGGGGGGGAA